MGSNKSHSSSLRLKLDITEYTETSKQTQYFRACGSTKADPSDPLLDGFYSSFSEANMETVFRVAFWTLIFCHHTRSQEGEKAINYISNDIYTHFL